MLFQRELPQSFFCEDPLYYSTYDVRSASSNADFDYPRTTQRAVRTNIASPLLLYFLSNTHLLVKSFVPSVLCSLQVPRFLSSFIYTHNPPAPPQNIPYTAVAILASILLCEGEGKVGSS